MAVVLVAAVAVGCGDGEDTASASVTKAQFLKRADAICATAEKERETAEASQQQAEAGTQAEMKKQAEDIMAEIIIPSLKKEQGELEGLDVPEDTSEQVEKILDSHSQMIKAFEEGGVEAVYQTKTVGTFKGEAEKYGLECEL